MIILFVVNIATGQEWFVLNTIPYDTEYQCNRYLSEAAEMPDFITKGGCIFVPESRQIRAEKAVRWIKQLSFLFNNL